MNIKLLLADITDLDVDVIVNAANSTLRGGGVDGAIHDKAGSKLLEECITLGGCLTGEAKITKGYNLKAKYVIHTVGPIWFDGKDSEEESLTKCYSNSLLLAQKYQLKTIAFPCISTGAYRFPYGLAAKIALNTVKSYSGNSIEDVIFCCYGERDYKEYDKLLNSSWINNILYKKIRQ